MEFVKDACKLKKQPQSTSCMCKWFSWIESLMGGIPCLFPDEETFRYKSVFQYPANSSDVKARPADEFMPRARIKNIVKRKLNTAKERLFFHVCGF